MEMDELINTLEEEECIEEANEESLSAVLDTSDIPTIEK